MQLLEDGVLAAFAAIGLLTVLMLLLSAILHPRRRVMLDALAVVPCREGEGAGLEATVRTLTRSRYEYGGFRRIVLLDLGMDEETKRIAALLCRDGVDVSLHTREELEHFYKHELE